MIKLDIERLGKSGKPFDEYEDPNEDQQFLEEQIEYAFKHIGKKTVYNTVPQEIIRR